MRNTFHYQKLATTLVPVTAVLLSAAILLVGNGLQWVLITVRAHLEPFSALTIGAMTTCYFAGFTAGCVLVPPIVRRVGYIRAFAVLIAFAGSIVLLLSLKVQPWLWIGLRTFAGFCWAGLFMVMESWLNAKSDNAQRGQVFGLYMVIEMSTVTVGQLLLLCGDPTDFHLFAVTALLIILALVPIALTPVDAPSPISHTRLCFATLYRLSPVGLIGSGCLGLANSAHVGLGPVYAQSAGLSVAATAIFMSAAMLGGTILQFPLGYWSDYTDRRRVIVLSALIAAAAGGILMLGGTTSMAVLPAEVLIGAVALFGGFAFPLYALCVAHINDVTGQQGFVETSSGLLLMYGIGASVGPTVAAFFMHIGGAAALYGFTACVHLSFALWTAYRLYWSTRTGRKLPDA